MTSSRHPSSGWRLEGSMTTLDRDSGEFTTSFTTSDHSWKRFLNLNFGALVVAQLIEQSLPTPEVGGSNRVIGKIYIEHLL